MLRAAARGPGPAAAALPSRGAPSASQVERGAGGAVAALLPLFVSGMQVLRMHFVPCEKKCTDLHPGRGWGGAVRGKPGQEGQRGHWSVSPQSLLQ